MAFINKYYKTENILNFLQGWY